MPKMSRMVACQDTLFIGISLILYLHICIGLVSSQGMQPDVRHIASSRYPVSTIISKMSSTLLSPYGTCSFPPKELLTNVDSDFLEMCDRKMPSFDKPVPDPGAIMCLGLLELGLRVCSLDKKYFVNDVVFALPKDSDSFNTLMSTLNQEKYPNLCADLKKVLERPMLDGDNFSLGLGTGLLKNWSLQNVLHEKEDSCSRICIDYSSKPQLLCKLILWGITNLLVPVQPISKPFPGVISHSVKSNVDLSDPSLIGQGQTDKLENEPFSQNVHDEVISEHGDKMNDLETGDGKIDVIPSSSEVTPIGEVKDIYKSKLPDNKSSEINNNFDAKKSSDITEAVLSQNETPHPVNSVESIKSTENLAGVRTTSIKQEGVISENPEKSLPKIDTASIDNIKSQEITFDEKPSLGPAEKVSTDMGGRGDDIHDQFDESFNEDLDDDDSNVEQIPMNHENTGYKADAGNKYSPEEFPNSNTFLQERFEDSEDSHFFSYFMAVVVLCIVGYVVFHNKQKILALALEGRSRRTTRRRSATANYHKLDNNLEEAVSSPCNTSVTHVIY